MPFIIVWVIQLVIFFAIVSSIATFFAKATKQASKQTHRHDASEMDAPKQPVRRNESTSENKRSRPVREKNYTRTPRVRDTVRESHKPIIKDVVTIKDPYRAKEKKVSTSFNKKRLKEAIVYKEILDKPVSMRDD